jgi:broad specificity phosphatase PhoE
VHLLLLARHGQSVFNVDGIVNGDPARDRGLSTQGSEEAAALGQQLAAVRIDVCVVSRFPRAQETAHIALGNAREAAIPRVIDDDLDDIRLGELEGRTLADYRAWKHGRSRDDPFPGGESLNDAARRYADAYARILNRAEETVLCVCHEIPVRYAINMASGSDEFDAPLHDVRNATPYVFDAAGLERAVERLHTCARR